MTDLVLDRVTLLTMDGERRQLDDGWLAINGGLIEALGTGEAPAAPRRIDGRGGVAMPGMVSTHSHVIDILLRGGLEQDRTLFDWLVNVYFAGTSAYTPEDCALAATLNLSEAARAGITTITDNWGVNNGDDAGRVEECAEATLAVYEGSGLRVVFGRMFSDTAPAAWEGILGAYMAKVPEKTLDLATLGEPLDEALARIEALIAAHHGAAEGRVSVCPAPIMAQLVSREGLAAARELAERHGTVVPIHHCESPLNSRVFPESGPGLGATDYLNALGFLNSRMLAAHCVWLDDRDIRLLAEHDVKVAHCPSCNSLLGSGAAPIPRLLAAGITAGLGTDDANTSSNVSIMQEMRQAAYVAKLTNADPGALTAEKALEMATIDGARALGLETEIGSLEVGKRADVVLFDTSAPHWYPRHLLPATIVYQAQASDVRTVLVDGRPVLDEREPTFLTEEPAALHERAQRASEAIVERAGMSALLGRGWQSRSRI